jgi:hypothetical protein
MVPHKDLYRHVREEKSSRVIIGQERSHQEVARSACFDSRRYGKLNLSCSSTALAANLEFGFSLDPETSVGTPCAEWKSASNFPLWRTA